MDCQALEAARHFFTGPGQDSQRWAALVHATASLIAAQHALKRFDEAADSCTTVMVLLGDQDQCRPVQKAAQQELHVAAALKQAAILRAAMVSSRAPHKGLDTKGRPAAHSECTTVQQTQCKSCNRGMTGTAALR